MLRASAAEQMSARSPGAHLQQLEAEYIVEREMRERRLLAQHSGPQRPFEPFGRRSGAHRFQPVLLDQKLAKFQCYRLNTPQNVNQCHSPERAAGSSLL